MRLRILRRIIQIFSILMIIAIPLLNRKGITALGGTLYSLSIDGIWITDPLAGFQIIISTLWADERLLFSMLLPVALALSFGRVFCSWVCPQNSLSEFFDHLSAQMRLKRLFNPPPSIKPRYTVLIALLLAVPFAGFPVASLLSAPGIISLQISKYVNEGVTGPEVALIGAIILSEIFLVRRLWCNHVCPIGSFLGIFRFKRTMKVVYREDPEHLCGRCFECIKACQLGLNPMEEKLYPLCHNCGDCVATCQSIKGKEKPLSFRF